MSEHKQQGVCGSRLFVILTMLLLACVVLVWRGVDLQITERDFLQNQGDARHLRVVSVPTHRGMITDRHGEPLAISTPVDSVWCNPKELLQVREQWPQLARVLELEEGALEALLSRRLEREFVYLRRHIKPQRAQQVMNLGVPGVFLQREYRRYYPAGEVAAHVVGFTNVDDQGQEGIELLYDDYLAGKAGRKRVVRDRLGRIIADVESISEPVPGNDLRLSIDRRLQYLTYRELKAAVQRHRAKAGSAVVMDVQSGEILAMVDQPAYNPNNRGDLRSEAYRNRAVTDVFEPGSTIKPFTIAAALESGRFTPHTPIETGNGFLEVGHDTVRDVRGYGRIDVTRVIHKSSNVGASKIALALEPKWLIDIFQSVGLGEVTGSSFPGEVAGSLSHRERWRDIERATLSFGYGLSVTPLQLAQAYALLGGDGQLRHASFLPADEGSPAPVPALKAETVKQIRRMLEGVVQEGGTGWRASIPGYRVAGKTGTVHKTGVGGYSSDRYLSLFAGVVPASRPRLAMVVIIDEPSAGGYYGGVVAAPVFAKVMGGALRLMDIAPDDVPSLGGKLVMAEAAQ